jgi:predicted cupin superfamily sugar epimerase
MFRGICRRPCICHYPLMSTASEIIERLELQPHPEGGWYRETWRAPAIENFRSAATAIHFLLERGQRSHWHRIDAAETWLFHAGDPLRLSQAKGDSGPITSLILGNEVLQGHVPQHVIPPKYWQAAEPSPAGTAGYTLVSCVVVPGFEFSGFQLAPPGWAPGSA